MADRYAELVRNARIYRRNLIGWTAGHGPSKAKREIAVTMAAAEIWDYIVRQRLAMVIVVLWLAAALAVGWFIGFASVAEAIAVIAAWCVLFVVFVTILLYPLYLATRKDRLPLPNAGSVFLSTAIGTGYVVAALRLLESRSNLRLATAAALLTAAATGVLWFVLNSAQHLIIRYSKHRLRSRHPRAVIAYNLVVAQWIAVGGLWPYRNTARDELFRRLEAAAATFDHLPRTLATGDPVTDGWARQEFAQVAAAVRELKKSVAVPAADSVSDLAEKLGAMSVAFTQCRWNELPKAEARHLSVKGVGIRILHLARGFAIAAIPLAVLAALGIRDQVLLIGATVWAAVGVIMAIDPDFAARLAAAKDLAGILRGK